MNKTRGDPHELFRLNAALLSKYQDVMEVVINYIKTTQIFSKDLSNDPHAINVEMVSKKNIQRNKKREEQRQTSCVLQNVVVKDT